MLRIVVTDFVYELWSGIANRLYGRSCDNVAVARALLALRAVVGLRAQRVASYYSVVCVVGGVDLVLGATLYRLFHAY